MFRIAFLTTMLACGVSAFAEEAMYGYLRCSLPDGWPSGPSRLRLHCDMPSPPEGKYYRLFLDGPIWVGADLQTFFRQAFCDSIGVQPPKGLQLRTSKSDDGQTIAYGTAIVQRRDGPLTYAAFCVVELDGIRQSAGIVTNDEQLWRKNTDTMDAFFTSLKLDRAALKDRSFERMLFPATRPIATTRPTED